MEKIENLDNGLGRIINYTDKIIDLFSGLDSEIIRILSQYTQEGVVWDPAPLEYAKELESVYKIILEEGQNGKN